MNFSNSGVGLSAGVKGARVSVNKRGVRTSIGAGGLYYTEQHGFNKSNNGQVVEEPRVSLERQQEMKDYLKTRYVRHRNLIAISIFCLICGARSNALLGLGIILGASGIFCWIKNKDRISQEHKVKVNSN